MRRAIIAALVLMLAAPAFAQEMPQPRTDIAALRKEAKADVAIRKALADAVLQPVEEAQQQVVKQVTDDVSKIYAGIEVGARPNGGQIAMQVIQQYVQQPDVMQRLQSDEAFKARLEKYVKQTQFIMQQAENAQIGKVGTKPAAVGGIQTQGMQAQ